MSDDLIALKDLPIGTKFHAPGTEASKRSIPWTIIGTGGRGGIIVSYTLQKNKRGADGQWHPSTRIDEWHPLIRVKPL